MRYWHPMSEAAAQQVAAFRPDRIVLLPLYPQFSTTTVASSLAAWHSAARAAGIAAPTRAVCCYPRADGLIAAHAALIEPLLAAAAEAGKPRLLFSAHGLPKRVVARGDPYQWQIEETARRHRRPPRPRRPGLGGLLPEQGGAARLAGALDRR